MREFIVTSDGTTVSDADLQEFVIDLLHSIYEEADDDGAVQLTGDQMHDIRQVLKMVDILQDKCSYCGGKGAGKYDDGTDWTCKACGGKGKLTYKREMVVTLPAHQQQIYEYHKLRQARLFR